MHLLVIDGQGGKLGRMIIEGIRQENLPYDITAVGTNVLATSAMLKAGADRGATGENPVVVNCREADVIVGPIGIISADALLGEVTADMAIAVGRSHATKLLLPVNQCKHIVIGTQALTLSQIISETVEQLKLLSRRS